MSSPDDKDEALKSPAGGSRTTPYGTPSTGDATVEFDLTDATAQALAARYDLLAELGRGGMGVVYKARDRETDEVIALKVLRPEVAARPDLIERFKSELRLARKITHKNVCRVYDINRFGTVAAISMEYVQGESLRAVLDRFGGVPLRRGLEWVGQVCSALAEAHAQGVVHRDLKPENIVITRDSGAKVMDFGIARSLDADATATAAGMLIGTPAYMSPEQAEGKPVDARSDIYALGLILYEMFTGRRAFEAETSVALVAIRLHETPLPPRSVEPLLPAVLARAIEKCLEKNPKKRFQSAAELAAALEHEELPGETATAPAAATPEPAELPLPPHLAAWQRSDAFVLAGGLAGFLLFLFLFPLVFPYESMRVEISRSQAEARARALLQKYAPSLAEADLAPRYVEQFEPWTWGDLVLAWGLPRAREFIRQHAISWLLQPPRGSGGRSPTLLFSRDATLLLLDVRPEQSARETRPPLPVEAVLPRAVEVAEEIFRLKLAGQPPVPYVFDARRSGWATPDVKRALAGSATPVQWLLPEGSERERELTLRFSPQGDLLSASHRLLEQGRPLPRPPGDRAHGFNWARAIVLGALLMALWVLLCLFLFVYRRLFAAVSPIALLLSLVVWAGIVRAFWVMGHEEPDFWSILPAVAAVNLLFAYGAVSPAVYYVSRRWPAQLATLARLVRERLRARPAGLALLRGTALGLAFLGAHAALLWLVGTLKLAAASSFWFVGFATVPILGENLTALSAAGLQLPATIGVLTLVSVGLPLSLLRGATARPAPLLGAMAALWALAASPLVGVGAFPLLPLYLFAALQGLFFAWVFLRFDMLTCLMGVFTVETGLLSYAVYRVFGAAEPWTHGWGLLLWFAVVVIGSAIWFRPQLAAARRRVAAVFE